MNTMMLLAAVTTFAWNANIPQDGLKYRVSDDGAIRLDLAGRGNHCGGDGWIWSNVPLYAKGTLDFEVKVQGPATSFGMCGFLSLYGIRVFWHDSTLDWRVYLPDAVRNRERNFDDEPSRHQRIAIFKPGEWHRCRIAFDHWGDRVEFFMDDMNDPALIVGNRSVWGEAEYMGGILAIGGMGASPKGVVEFRNLKLEEAAKGEAAKAPRTETLVFEGCVNDYYRSAKRLQADKPRVYTLDSTRAVIFPLNEFKYSSLPGASTIARARRIVIEDAPAGPNGLIPNFVLEDIAAAVEDGAELIVLDGPFTLNRGEYRGTAIERIVPEGAMPDSPFARFERPEILERSVGKGKVKVFRGLAFGDDPEAFNAPGSAWCKFAAELFK